MEGPHWRKDSGFSDDEDTNASLMKYRDIWSILEERVQCDRGEALGKLEIVIIYQLVYMHYIF